MVKTAEIKLLSHLPNEHIAGSSPNGRKIGKRNSDHVIRLSLLEEKTARHQAVVHSQLREVHPH